jgi:hypothetical protein
MVFNDCQEQLKTQQHIFCCLTAKSTYFELMNVSRITHTHSVGCSFACMPQTLQTGTFSKLDVNKEAICK